MSVSNNVRVVCRVRPPKRDEELILKCEERVGNGISIGDGEKLMYYSVLGKI